MPEFDARAGWGYWKDRFLSRTIVDESGCWNYTGFLDRDGYGMFRVGPDQRRAHRVSYEMFVADIPDGLVMDHLCRNRSCVNPTHLEPVTVQENTLRGSGITANNALKTHCPSGHEYSADNLVICVGRRVCRRCRSARNQRYDRENREKRRVAAAERRARNLGRTTAHAKPAKAGDSAR